MDQQVMSWIVVTIGLVGFILAGQKIWWCWYVNVFCQVLWYIYAWVSNQPAFYISALVYTVVFTRNAIKWTKDHRKNKSEVVQGLYRTKAVPIDARYFDGGVDSAEEIIAWLSEHLVTAWWKEEAKSRITSEGKYIVEMPETIRIMDRRGTLDLAIGEYVVLGSNETVYIFQAEAFESAYEKVELTK